MSEYSTVFGIDSHARTTTVCAIVVETGETATRTFPGVSPYAEIASWMSSFPGPRMGWYEAGCTGFTPARTLSGGDTRVAPIATHSMPTSPESRARKTDRTDAARLARAGLAGQLSEVWVPDPGVEGLRDACHLLEDLSRARAAARLRVDSLPLRHGVVWDERTRRGALRKQWGEGHWAWLRSVRLADPASQRALGLLLAEARHAQDAYDEALEAAAQLCAASPLAPVVAALQHLKGCGFVTALSFAAEVGDFPRFRSGRRVTPCFGLAPAERPGGGRRRLCGISKSGCATVGALLTEAAWRHAGADGSRGKRGPAGVPPEVAEHARSGSRRLTARRRAMLGRGVAPCKANAATAAEMARWLWAVGLEAQQAARA